VNFSMSCGTTTMKIPPLEAASPDAGLQIKMIEIETGLLLVNDTLLIVV
jgi:hypothetical protein